MTPEAADGGNAVHTAIAAVRRLVAAIGIFSLFANLLMLTGPLYMLQVYDRVLASRSVPTLAALTVLIALLFLTLGQIRAFGPKDEVLARVLKQARQDNGNVATIQSA